MEQNWKLNHVFLSISQRRKTGKQTSHCRQSQEAFCLWRSNETKMPLRLLRHDSCILFTTVQHKLLPACVSDYYTVQKMAASEFPFTSMVPTLSCTSTIFSWFPGL